MRIAFGCILSAATTLIVVFLLVGRNADGMQAFTVVAPTRTEPDSTWTTSR